MVSRVTRGLGVTVLLAACLQAATAFGSNSTTKTRSPDAAGEVKKLSGGAVLRISPGTRVEFERAVRLQLGPASAPKTLTHTIRLISGRVEVDLPEGKSKTPATAVLIRAPHKISAVAKGGRSIVIAAPSRVTVAAVRGEMLAAHGNQWRPVGSGIVREFAAGGAPLDHAVIAAPQVSLSAPLAFHIAGASAEATPTATATPVPRAAGYDFGIWKMQGNGRVLLRRLRSEGPTLELPSLEPGSYGISARALEPSGLESNDSELVPLRVVGAELPLGAKLVEGGVLLRPHQRITLHGTEGVEISYGQVPHFVPAPGTIGLIRGQPTLVRLRAAGTQGELALALEPKTIHADIQIGPPRALWPQDQVSVSVRLTDGRGRPLLATDEVQPIVHVNLTEVPLDWKRKDNLLTTVVPHPAEAGPWVVRVEVKDETGVLVARDFLEVAQEQRRAQR